mmetsp:Transcript_9161/g.12536  ORF Transcript_9161/g.12536 Transcript_9161/m.12536 type:complete len:98 (-) Transcript_9161:883-1176(-)
MQIRYDICKYVAVQLSNSGVNPTVEPLESISSTTSYAPSDAAQLIGVCPFTETLFNNLATRTFSLNTRTRLSKLLTRRLNVIKSFSNPSRMAISVWW